MPVVPPHWAPSGLVARLRSLWRGLWRRETIEAEMEEEFRHHIGLRAEDLMRGEGLTRKEAYRRARLEFGHVETHRAEARASRGIHVLDWIGFSVLDFKVGVRRLIRHPGLTVVGGLGMTVAIAVGAGSFEAIQTFLDPVLPVPGGDRVVALQMATSNPGNPERRILHDFVTWREQLTSVEQVAAFRSVRRNVATSDGLAEPVLGAEMTASGFEVAGTPPLIGRPLLPEDERPGAPVVVVLGHDLWTSRFGADPGIVDRTIALGSARYTVVGVMPEGFEFPMFHRFWTPIETDPSGYERLEGPAISVFGRLAPGTTMEEARAELRTIGRRTAGAHPATHADLRPNVLPYTQEAFDIEGGAMVWGLRLVQLLVSLLLVVVCVNVAILVYARTVARTGEIAVRSALGASRRHLLIQLFAEGLVLSLLSAGAGLLLAHGALSVVQSELDRATVLPFWFELSLSPATVLYALALAVLAAVIVGVLPGLKATGRRLQASLREVSQGSGTRLGRTWSGLVVAQVAAAVALLPAAILVTWGLVRPALVDPGIPAEELLVASVGVGGEPAPGSPEADRVAYEAAFERSQRELSERLLAGAGVIGVAWSQVLPGEENTRPIEIEGGEGEGAEAAARHRTRYIRTGPELFDVYDAQLLGGRLLDAGDMEEDGTRVVVNRSFVEHNLGGGNALGRRFRYEHIVNVDYPGERGQWFEVVGVVSDFPADAFSAPERRARAYHAMAPGAVEPAYLSVRTAGPPRPALSRRVRELALEVDRDLQLRGARTMSDVIAEGMNLLYLTLGGIALVTLSVLLLSAAGIYALTSFTVAKRTREIGIRSALGASSLAVVGTVLRRVAGQVILGVGAGALVAGASFTLTGVTTGRAAALLGAASAFALVSLLAALGPARRALRIQPTEALKEL